MTVAKFNKFIGQILKIVTEHPDKPYAYDSVNHDDPLFREIESLAIADGFKLRTWLPKTIGTCDYDTSRVNMYVNDTGVITSFKIG